MSPRKFALAQVHSDVCLVQGTVKVHLLLSAAPFPNAFSSVLPPLSSLLLARTRKLPLGAQRDRSANLCPRIHHHLPVLAPRRASPVGHPDSRVARRAERVGRGGQGDRLPRSGCHGTSSPTHRSPAVYRGAAEPFFPRRKTDAMMVSIVSRPGSFRLSESNCTCIICLQVA
jgi:hypothetical protein